MRKSATWNRLLATTVFTGAAAVAFANPAYAQTDETGGVPVPTDTTTLSGENAEVSEEEAATGQIVVTGSRIARPDLTAASPVTIVDAEQVELTGTVTLETLINDLPQVIPGNNRTSNNAGGFAFATLDLRGLGPNRNLILVDGERLPASSTSGVVDISQIPTGLIERIDVVTGGASAVYGSDAISGVINFILKEDFEGLELTGQTGIAENGTGFSFSTQGLFGGNFDDGRGNMTVSASYYDRDAVSQSRFAYSRTSAALAFAGPDGPLIVVDDPSDIPAGGFVVFSGGSATTPFGQVVNSASNPFQNLSTVVGGNFTGFDNDCNAATPGTVVNGGSLSFDANGNLRPYSSSGNCAIPVGNSSRYNFAPANLLLIPYNRINLATTARYEFDDTLTGKLFMSYTDSESQVELAPTPAAGGTGFVIGVDSPLIPADLAAALASRPDPDAPFSFNRRFGETGPRIGINESRTTTIRGTLEKQLNPDWMLSGTVSYGEAELDTLGIGNINRTAVEQGLAGCRNADGVVNGTGVLPGCVPVDIFGINTLTPDMVRFIQTDTFDTDEFEQLRAVANIAGSMFELPGGPVGVAAGVEYRKDTGSSRPDDAKIRGEIIGFNQANPLEGEISVKEVYGEIRLPVLGGNGFPDLLAFEAGARYSDYSTVGGLFNYKLAAEFAPVSWVRFRGAFNRAARAPSVFELFQNGDQGFPGYNDPCNAINAARDEAFCIAQGVPASAIDTFAQSNSQVQAFAFGNPNLEEETAETYTVGAVISPSRFPIGRFSATVDYYDITINNLNSAQGAQFFINDCYNNQNATSCARITRDPANGQITRVNTTRVNSDTPLSTSGVDVGLNWVIPLDEIGFGSGGRIRISELFTWVDSYKLGESEFADVAFAGIGGITSEFASTLTVGYEEDQFTGQVRYVYKSGGSQCEGLFGCPDEGGPVTPRVPDLHQVDMSLRWAVSDNFSLTGIVHNILDKYPPVTAGGTLDQANINAAFFSPLILGRNYTVQAQVRF